MPRQSAKTPGDHPQNQPSGDPKADEVVEANALGRRIDTRLRELGLTKADLMRLVGVKRWATIHDWVTGRQIPRAINLFRLAEALKMDPIALLDELLPEPDTDGWRAFKARNADKIATDDLIDMRVLARRRPYLTAPSLEAALSVLRVGAP